MTRPSDGPVDVAEVSHATLYSYLVTRQTGEAVRTSIEERLAGRAGPVVTVLDFRHVAIIDFSCADEVVAKLADSALDAAGEDGRGARRRFFLFTGLDDRHLDPVESALGRRGLTVAAERADGSPCLLGELDEGPRRAWERVVRSGAVRPEALARERGCPPGDARGLLEGLHRRRLVVRRGGEYLSLRRAIDARVDGGGGDG